MSDMIESADMTALQHQLWMVAETLKARPQPVTLDNLRAAFREPDNPLQKIQDSLRQVGSQLTSLSRQIEEKGPGSRLGPDSVGASNLRVGKPDRR
jgi:hypothetical protein